MQDKPLTYYSPTRSEISHLLPPRVERSLEIGCGTGSTSAWIKQKYGSYAAGVEVFEDVAREADKTLDKVVVGDIEKLALPFAADSFDLILCLDVLEHLVDPWTVVKRLSALLTPGGTFIASIPNLQHYATSFNLLRGKFRYVNSGPLDETHLRFFVLDTAQELFTRSGLKVESVDANMGRLVRLLDTCTLKLFHGFCSFQYLVKATR